MNWRKRLRQWLYALKLAGVTHVPWLGLVRAILSGPVPRRVWRGRLRYGCFQCPVYSKIDGVMLCKSTHPDMPGAGCGCYLPFLALWAAPYKNGCWGKQLEADIGWPVYHWPSRRFRFRSTIDFLLRR